jgi:Zn-dependent protease
VTANRDWRFLFGGNVWFSSARRTRARDLVVLLAGPMANLLTLGTVLAVHRLLNGPALFGIYVRANAVCAGAVLLTNLLPLPRTREGYATDGRQILDLLRGRRIA